MDIWQWYLDGSNAAKLAKLCAKINGGDFNANYDKAIDAMIEYGNEWISKHDPERAALSTYILMRIGYSLYEKPKNLPSERSLTDLDAKNLTYSSRELAEPNEKLLGVFNHLSGYDQWLITARHVYGLSFTMMGEKLGVRKGLIREHYLRAMNRAKRYL